MNNLGDFDEGTIIYGKFATYRPSTGATFTLGGTPALSVYKDSSTTQSTSGVTLTVDFDGVTGLNHFAIDTSSDGAFYSAGSFFDVVITTGTVDSVSVTGSVVGSFTLEAVSAVRVQDGTGTGQLALSSGAIRIQTGTGTGQLDVTSGAIKIQGTIKKNVAVSNYPFLMRDTAGLPRTGLTVTATRKLDAGAFAACANAVSEVGNGWYEIDLDASDLNGDTIALSFTATGSSGTYATILTVP